MAQKKSDKANIKPHPIVRLAHLDYPIIEKEFIRHNGDEALGLCEMDTQTITIKSSLEPQQKVRVIIHEVLHAIMDIYGIELSEKDNDLLAVGLTSFLKENRIYVEELMDELE